MRSISSGSAATKMIRTTFSNLATLSSSSSSSCWFCASRAEIMLSLTTPVITDRSDQEENIVNTTKTIFKNGHSCNSGSTRTQSCPFMIAKSVNMEAKTSWKSSWFAGSASLMPSSPWPTILVISMAEMYSATSVRTRTQNMLCIASTTPIAKMYNGRTAFTKRTRRRIRRSRRVRASKTTSPSDDGDVFLATSCIQKFLSHSSKAPNITMQKSSQFQAQSAETKKPNLWRLSRTEISKTK
mmetsp:Transcript_66830/g.186585  ORF Transcript_66830/g.186585 Transcript_66830/m.186585 type:complete len:241 (+) Transcript_66830:366-1088(+)